MNRGSERYRHHPPMPQEEFKRICKKHGLTTFVRETYNPKQTRCKICRVESTTERRRKVKRLLVESFGGKCIKCGYSKCIEALDFHHRDRNEKSFALSHGGFTRSFEKALAEAKKCDLLCCRCHREIEAELIPE
jgi:hypothetical protein